MARSENDDARIVSAVYSTLSGEAVGRAVEASYPLAPVAECRLLLRGRNDVYELRRADGLRCIVRVSPHRRSGDVNVGYELALLAHLKRAGLAVASVRFSKLGESSIEIAAVEGARALVVFDLLSGEAPSDHLSDFALMGAGLSRIHGAAEHYRGPSSVHRLDVEHLVRRPLRRVLSLPTVDDPMREAFSGLATELAQEIDRRKNLSLVTCHGDYCVPNVLVDTLPTGERSAACFDFEDGGPGYLAYDLATFLWGELVQTDTLAVTDLVRERWTHFLDGYRQVAPLAGPDLEATGQFVLARHFWWMGECASHVEEVGTQDMPLRWLRAQLATLQAWQTSLVKSLPEAR